jgi:hypothetical protein
MSLIWFPLNNLSFPKFEICAQGQGSEKAGQVRFQTLPLFLLWNYAPVYSGIRVLSTYFSIFFS